MKQTELELSLETDYSRLPDEKVLLLGTHTTRYDGFVDMLLSGKLMTSQAAHDLLGDVQTRQGTCFGDPETSAARLDYLSFGAGHVSFGYSEPGINQRSFEAYDGGLGIFIP